MLRRDQPIGQVRPALGTVPGVAQLQALQARHEGALAGAGVLEHILADAAGHEGFGDQIARREGVVGIVHTHEDVGSR